MARGERRVKPSGRRGTIPALRSGACYASRVRAIAAPCALLGSLLVLVAGRASAEPGRTSSLSWLRMPGADACIATQALARSVEERLGRHVFVSAADADVSVEGRIERRTAAPGWHAVITIRDSKGALLGTRELDRPEPSCEAMNDPLALVIAVMIDPEAKLSSTPKPLPPSLPVPDPLPDPLPEPAPPEPGPPAPRAGDPLRVEGAVTGIVASGLGPMLDPGASVSGVLFPPGIPIGLRGYTALFLPTQGEKDGARGTFDLLYVGGGLCPTLRGKVAVGMVCLGGQLGVVRSHGDTKNRGIEEKTLPLFNAAVEARVSFPLIAPLALTAGVAGILPLARPTFQYTRGDPALGQDNLHKVSGIAITGDVGIAFFFP